MRASVFHGPIPVLKRRGVSGSLGEHSAEWIQAKELYTANPLAPAQEKFICANIGGFNKSELVKASRALRSVLPHLSHPTRLMERQEYGIKLWFRMNYDQISRIFLDPCGYRAFRERLSENNAADNSRKSSKSMPANPELLAEQITFDIDTFGTNDDFFSSLLAPENPTDDDFLKDSAESDLRGD
jgi:hypothetical protein